jgi:hemolysin activation/secretion protein
MMNSTTGVLRSGLVMISIMMSLGIIWPKHLGAEEPTSQTVDPAVPAAEEVATFEIKAFMVEGNTLFPDKDERVPLYEFTGLNKTAADVEKARDVLEKFFHEKGFPTVFVSIPEQSLEDGIVRFQIIESTINSVTVNGNRYFSTEQILDDLPSMAPGEIIYLPTVQSEINKVNLSPDLKVTPNLVPGKEVGTVDVELKVEDHLPLHGSVELNNRYTAGTTDLRLNGMLRYDNLWKMKHSVSVQFQTSPENTDEVQAYSGAYSLPVPGREEDRLALYGIYNKSNTAFGEGFTAIGNGSVIGLRYQPLLPQFPTVSQFMSVGVDYKDFKDETGLKAGNSNTTTPITYVPFSLAYGLTLMDTTGYTQFSGSVNVSFQGLTTESNFDNKRYNAHGNYLYALLGIERTQNLPLEMTWYAKVDGQISDQPLISNEQYSAGGMDNVRGYHESEAMGDNALHVSTELRAPDLFQYGRYKDKLRCTPYLFYQGAWLEVMDPLPGQQRRFTLQGIGLGMRGGLWGMFEYGLDWGHALNSTTSTQSGKNRVHFFVKHLF